MVFSSTSFLFMFLPFVLIGYYLIRKDGRNIFLFAVSCLFYAWAGIKPLLLLIATIIANYLIGLLIEKIRSKNIIYRGLAIVGGLTIDLGLLFYYKYFNFTIENINSLLGISAAARTIILPLGISFYVFSEISYLLDVSKGKIGAEHNFLDFMLFVSFFPKLAQGPIARYGEMKRQLAHHSFHLDQFFVGVQRFTIGLSKKVIIANLIAQAADAAFDGLLGERTILMAWIGSISYTMQIYFDFSGYSDMAIGLGKLFGFDLPENFDLPYTSTSVTEFWRRWHITLGSWFREYVYIPLGGNRRGNVYLNLAIVFLLTGIWHGANWTFIFWGCWHGFFMLFERFLKQHHPLFKLPKIIQWLYCFNIVNIGWIFFRSKNISSGFLFVKDMFNFGNLSFANDAAWLLLRENAVLLILTFLFSVKKNKLLGEYGISSNNGIQTLRCSCLLILLVISISLITMNQYDPFIYFNF